MPGKTFEPSKSRTAHFAHPMPFGPDAMSQLLRDATPDGKPDLYFIWPLPARVRECVAYPFTQYVVPTGLHCLVFEDERWRDNYLLKFPETVIVVSGYVTIKRGCK